MSCLATLVLCVLANVKLMNDAGLIWTNVKCCVSRRRTSLAKQDLELLNCMRCDFHGAGNSTSDLTASLLWGRFGSME